MHKQSQTSLALNLQIDPEDLPLAIITTELIHPASQSGIIPLFHRLQELPQKYLIRGDEVYQHQSALGSSTLHQNITLQVR